MADPNDDTESFYTLADFTYNMMNESKLEGISIDYNGNIEVQTAKQINQTELRLKLELGSQTLISPPIMIEVFDCSNYVKLPNVTRSMMFEYGSYQGDFQFGANIKIQDELYGYVIPKDYWGQGSDRDKVAFRSYHGQLMQSPKGTSDLNAKAGGIGLANETDPSPNDY